MRPGERGDDGNPGGLNVASVQVINQAQEPLAEGGRGFTLNLRADDLDGFWKGCGPRAKRWWGRIAHQVAQCPAETACDERSEVQVEFMPLLSGASK